MLHPVSACGSSGSNGVPDMVDDPRDRDPKSAPVAGAPLDEAALAHRMKRLGDSLEVRRAADEVKDSPGRRSGFARAIKVASEFVAGIAVGTGLGWLIDRMAGTTPWAMIVFLFLGFAAGVLNVLRAEGMVAEAEWRKAPADRKERSPENRG